MEKKIKIFGRSIEQARYILEAEIPYGYLLKEKKEYFALTGDEIENNRGISFISRRCNYQDAIPIEEALNNNALDFYIDNIIAYDEREAELSAKNKLYKLTKEYFFAPIDWIETIKKGRKGFLKLGRELGLYKAYGQLNWIVIKATISNDKKYAINEMFKYARKEDITGVKKMLSYGADINAKDDEGSNLLFYFLHDAKFSNYLIRNGINYKCTNKFGKNVLDGHYYYYGNGHILSPQLDNKLVDFLIDNGVEDPRPWAKTSNPNSEKSWCPQCKTWVATSSVSYNNEKRIKIRAKCTKCQYPIEK